MHYLQDDEKDVIFDALAYYSTHAIKNTPPEQREALYKTIKVILNKVNDIAEVTGVKGEGLDAPTVSETAPQQASPKQSSDLSYKTEAAKATPHHDDPPLPPKPTNVNPEQWEKLVSMGLNDLTEWPFTDWTPH